MNNGYYMYKCKKAENEFYTVLKSHKELSSPESILHVNCRSIREKRREKKAILNDFLANSQISQGTRK